MQARQTQLDRISERLEQTAVIQERTLARLDSLEHWRDEQDRRMERQEERRDDRIEKVPDSRRADWALIIAGATMLLYLLTFMSQHWK